MVFTTQIFLFVFFPVVVIAYIVCELLEKLKNIGDYVKKFRIKVSDELPTVPILHNHMR